jgi:dTDP-4-dehydrorhamnose reductase
MPLPAVIVTGANGQLGKELAAMSTAYPRFQFVFLSKEDLAIDRLADVQGYFNKLTPAFCINCAAYTAVDKAETDRDAALRINAGATGLLASVCKSFNTRFIHISTDYVFDGTATMPYKETDPTSPVNYYGLSKLKGEQLAFENNNGTIVIRTAWVYSEYGNNFVKTMMRLMKEREQLNVVNDQFGSPTYAADLAKAILEIIAQSHADNKTWAPGIYHYSNEGVISWYDFAVAIKTLTGSNCSIHPVPSTAYPTPAKRPAYSVFNKNKIKSTWNLTINDWQSRLAVAIGRLQK